ncbi:MAG: riboflavin synthase [Actinobacteria bacterium]|nr:riboflavin synthase [Actinomycetota bacterium]
MFTGIIEEIGTVAAVERRDDGVVVTIACQDVLGGTDVGASISVSGVCLTVTALVDGGFTADLAASTLAITTLDDVAPGRRVNLERPLAADGRFGGHLVQGHVDSVGTVTDVHDEEGTRFVRFRVPDEVATYLVPKGSVTLDGVSLTIVDVGSDGFDVALIPHTLEVTTLGALSEGDRVNVEVDVVGKYVAQYLQPHVDRLAGGGEC